MIKIVYAGEILVSTIKLSGNKNDHRKLIKIGKNSGKYCGSAKYNLIQ